LLDAFWQPALGVEGVNREAGVRLRKPATEKLDADFCIRDRRDLAVRFVRRRDDDSEAHDRESLRSNPTLGVEPSLPPPL